MHKQFICITKQNTVTVNEEFNSCFMGCCVLNIHELSASASHFLVFILQIKFLELVQNNIPFDGCFFG